MSIFGKTSVSDAAAKTVKFPPAPVALGSSERDEREEDGERSHRSTMIEVALTTAVAESPGSRASSSAASLVITETIRKGPASSSTWASKPSIFTSRTVPVEPVSGGQIVVERPPAEPLHLARQDDAPIGVVATRANTPLAVPAPERVDADAEAPCSLPGGVRLPRHRLGNTTVRQVARK